MDRQITNITFLHRDICLSIRMWYKNFPCIGFVTFSAFQVLQEGTATKPTHPPPHKRKMEREKERDRENERMRRANERRLQHDTRCLMWHTRWHPILPLSILGSRQIIPQCFQSAGNLMDASSASVTKKLRGGRGWSEEEGVGVVLMTALLLHLGELSPLHILSCRRCFSGVAYSQWIQNCDFLTCNPSTKCCDTSDTRSANTRPYYAFG